MSKTLDEMRQECIDRRAELEPFVIEHARLTAVLAELERIISTPVKLTGTVPRARGGRPKRPASS